MAMAHASYRPGDRGEDIIHIQSRLSALGYEVGPLDGEYGSKTIAAVKAFQRDHGLTVDGIVGPETYRTLFGRDIPVSRSNAVAAIRRVVAKALQYQGVPYVFGGMSPSGFDCSGFIRYVFAEAGISLPRTADAQYLVGYAIDYLHLQPGDLVFFTTYLPGPSHSGIYLGNGKFISATSSRGVAVVSMDNSYWKPRYIGARRVL